MNVFVWDNHFATGVEAVDAQHFALIELINRLGNALAKDDGSNDELLQATFDQLFRYAQTHFAGEEREMLDAGIDTRHLNHHRGSHQRFIEQLANMWTSRDGTEKPAAVLHNFLTAWLSFHILEEDQAMARQLKLISRGHSAAVAFETDGAPSDNNVRVLLGAIDNLYKVISEQSHDLANANLMLERIAEHVDKLTQTNTALTEANLRLKNRNFNRIFSEHRKPMNRGQLSN